MHFTGKIRPFMASFTPLVGNRFYNWMTQGYLCEPYLKKRLYMRKLVSFIAGMTLMVSASQAQQVTGTVKDQQGKGLEKSTVSLLNAKDSSVVKLAVTSDNGKFSVNTSRTGKYLLSVSHVNYVTGYYSVFDLSGSG